MRCLLRSSRYKIRCFWSWDDLLTPSAEGLHPLYMGEAHEGPCVPKPNGVESTMKILQTLSRGSRSVGVFAYCRTSNGVHIYPISSVAGDIVYTHGQWNDILKCMEHYATSALALSAVDGESIYFFLIQAGVVRDYAPYVAAILEHEGSIDHAHSPTFNVMLSAETDPKHPNPNLRDALREFNKRAGEERKRMQAGGEFMASPESVSIEDESEEDQPTTDEE